MFTIIFVIYYAGISVLSLYYLKQFIEGSDESIVDVVVKMMLWPFKLLQILFQSLID